MDMPLKPGARTWHRILIVAAILGGGCSSGAGVLGPNNQPEVSNITDTFQWQASKLAGVTQTLTYSWTNTGGVANINQACSLSGGSAVLTVADATGTEVYSGSLASNGTFQSLSGTAGDWTVTVELSNATGTLNFRLQKP